MNAWTCPKCGSRYESYLGAELQDMACTCDGQWTGRVVSLFPVFLLRWTTYGNPMDTSNTMASR